MNKDLDEILSDLLSDLYTPLESVPVAAAELEKFRQNLVCILPCGGESKRMAGLTETHKTALELPGEETLISRMIRMYADGGVKKFILLVGIGADSVIKSTRYLSGLDIRYSPDPGKPVGRGGAILNAIVNGLICKETNAVIHNADDQILGYPGDFVTDICRAHVANQKAGAWMTAIVARFTPYTYSAMRVVRGMVTHISDRPTMPVPTHIGVTLMSPEVYSVFEKLFNLTEKKDFEGYIWPILAREERLYAYGVPGNCWYPVNNPKEYETLVKALQKSK